MQGASTKATWPTTPTQNIKPSHAPKNGHQNRTDVLTIRPPMKQNQSVEASNKTALRNFAKTRRNLAFSMGEVRGKDWQIHRRQVPANIRLVFSTTVKSCKINYTLKRNLRTPSLLGEFQHKLGPAEILLSSLSWLHALQMRLENRGAGLQRKICKCRRWIQLSFSQPCFSEFFRDTSTLPISAGAWNLLLNLLNPCRVSRPGFHRSSIDSHALNLGGHGSWVWGITWHLTAQTLMLYLPCGLISSGTSVLSSLWTNESQQSKPVSRATVCQGFRQNWHAASYNYIDS